jgi:hypothetical protein
MFSRAMVILSIGVGNGGAGGCRLLAAVSYIHSLAKIAILKGCPFRRNKIS